jgi:hypothetical protein
MSNEKNLRPVRSKEEARERGRNGGIASVKSRRQKKDMKQRLQDALELAVVNPKVKSMMQQVGMSGEGTNWDAVAASIVAGTIQGASGYAKLLMELIGETGAEKRAERADKRDAKRLKMEAEEFELKRSGNTEDNDMVLRFINGMRDDNPNEKAD